MYIERLSSGQYGVFRNDGVRVAVKATKDEALRYKTRVITGGKRRKGRRTK